MLYILPGADAGFQERGSKYYARAKHVRKFFSATAYVGVRLATDELVSISKGFLSNKLLVTFFLLIQTRNFTIGVVY